MQLSRHAMQMLFPGYGVTLNQMVSDRSGYDAPEKKQQLLFHEHFRCPFHNSI